MTKVGEQKLIKPEYQNVINFYNDFNICNPFPSRSAHKEVINAIARVIDNILKLHNERDVLLKSEEDYFVYIKNLLKKKRVKSGDGKILRKMLIKSIKDRLEDINNLIVNSFGDREMDDYFKKVIYYSALFIRIIEINEYNYGNKFELFTGDKLPIILQFYAAFVSNLINEDQGMLKADEALSSILSYNEILNYRREIIS